MNIHIITIHPNKIVGTIIWCCMQCQPDHSSQGKMNLCNELDIYNTQLQMPGLTSRHLTCTQQYNDVW